MTTVHNHRCEASIHKVCKCRCNGSLHGRLTVMRKIDEYNDAPMYYPITKDFGGEVEQFLNNVTDKELECWCGNKLLCAGFEGYGPSKEVSGLKDKDGGYWWVYLTCDKCEFAWSYWKVERRAKERRLSLIAE